MNSDTDTGWGGIATTWKPAKNTAGKVQADGYKILADGHIIGSSKNHVRE